ncbi:ankyrin repeat family protein isoform X1 [Carex rostrata]
MSENPPPFQEASRCDVCNCSFTTFRRRHHCRCCGKTLCSDHSSYQMPLPQFGLHTNVRVCYECFNKTSSVVKSGTKNPSEGIISDGISKLTMDEDKSSSYAPTSGNETTATTVTECKCSMPLCICESAKPAPVAIQVQSATASTVQANPRPKKTNTEPGARKSAASSSNSSSSSFLNLGQTNNSSLEKSWTDYDVTGEGLREAIKNGDARAVRNLLSQGVDPNYRDKQGFTVLHLAALFNQTEITLILMDSGADVGIKNPQGETALDCAPAMLQYKMRERIKEIAVVQSEK